LVTIANIYILNFPAKLFVTILFVASAHSLLFAQITGKVVSVADGDTFTLLTDDKEQIKIRLHGIDCPEKSQDYGQVAKQYLSDLVFGKTVEVEKTDVDRYGRTIGKVKAGLIAVNEAMLKAGLAWHYKKYDHNPEWAKLEDDARAAKIGLWSKSDAQPPWDYRKLH
jgi:micrococcal nuclease